MKPFVILETNSKAQKIFVSLPKIDEVELETSGEQEICLHYICLC